MCGYGSIQKKARIRNAGINHYTRREYFSILILNLIILIFSIKMLFLTENLNQNESKVLLNDEDDADMTYGEGLMLYDVQ